MARKTFNKSLYAKYDEQAKQATWKALESRGYSVANNPNKYAQDLLANKGDKSFCVECEVKAVWKGENFPYGSVQLPERKKKFFDKPTLFFIWNNNLTRAVLFWDHHVTDLEPVEVPNKYLDREEKFFQIPLSRVKFI